MNIFEDIDILADDDRKFQYALTAVTYICHFHSDILGDPVEIAKCLMIGEDYDGLTSLYDVILEGTKFGSMLNDGDYITLDVMMRSMEWAIGECLGRNTKSITARMWARMSGSSLDDDLLHTIIELADCVMNVLNGMVNRNNIASAFLRGIPKEFGISDVIERYTQNSKFNQRTNIQAWMRRRITRQAYDSIPTESVVNWYWFNSDNVNALVRELTIMSRM